MTQTEPKTAAEMQKMRRRNWWVLGLIFGFVFLFYIITIVKMGI